MTNTITILGLIAILGISVPSAFACPEGNIQHWNEFTWSTGVDNFVHATEPTIVEGVAHVTIVEVDDSKTFSILQLLADKLNEQGYVREDNGNPIVPNDINRLGDVLYSTICKDGVQQMIGGMLLQPDATAMFLAYGIANAIWLAPTLAGLGAGIYLTK